MEGKVTVSEKIEILKIIYKNVGKGGLSGGIEEIAEHYEKVIEIISKDASRG